DEVWQAIPIGDAEMEKSKGIKNRWLWMGIAATILMICTLGLYFYHDNKVVPDQPVRLSVDDFLPGGNRAILTLGDGERILLNDVGIGPLANEGQTAIIKTKEGEIVYDSQQISNEESTAKKPVSYHTLS